MRWGIVVALLCAVPALAGDRFSEPAPCDQPSLADPVCRAPRAWTPAQAATALGSREEAAFSDGDVLNVVARRTAGPVTLCCTIDAPLERIGDSDLYALSVRVLDLPRAVIDLQLSPAGKSLSAFYGKQVGRPPVAAHLLGSLHDEDLPSAALGETRRLTIYLPPSFDRAQRYPVVYMADGATVAGYAPAIEAQIVAGRVRPVIVVGLWAALRDPGARAREYLVGRSYVRFRDHARFLLNEVMPYAERVYGASGDPKERMVAGFSDGAGWALAMGLREPQTFGTIGAFSLGWLEAAGGVASDTRPRLYLAAGLLEPDFHRTTAQAARRAQASAAPLLFEEFASGHVPVAWQTMLLDALAWTFPRH